MSGPREKCTDLAFFPINYITDSVCVRVHTISYLVHVLAVQLYVLYMYMYILYVVKMQPVFTTSASPRLFGSRHAFAAPPSSVPVLLRVPVL